MDRTEEMVTNEAGGKKAAKKAKFSMLPWEEVWDLAEHFGAGAEKYERDNWKRVDDLTLFEDALGRHFALYMNGEEYDPETGSHHLIAVVWHALVLVWHLKKQAKQALHIQHMDDLLPEQFKRV